VPDGEPGSFEADYWCPSNSSAVAAVRNNVYANFGSELVGTPSEPARLDAEVAGTAELLANCELLRDLFGEHLGPPGEEGGWLPSGPELAHPISQPEQWCLLPTPRNLTLRAEWLVWNEATIPWLAQAIYEEQAFDRLPILADALEEAGCDRPEWLEHLRGPGPHRRGCWVLDAILGNM